MLTPAGLRHRSSLEEAVSGFELNSHFYAGENLIDEIQLVDGCPARREAEADRPSVGDSRRVATFLVRSVARRERDRHQEMTAPRWAHGGKQMKPTSGLRVCCCVARRRVASAGASCWMAAWGAPPNAGTRRAANLACHLIRGIVRGQTMVRSARADWHPDVELHT
jgi:hypothetical protein